jgi:tungstate transport system ATP-binding protein
MNMRAPATNLPVQFDQVEVVVGDIRILDGISHSFVPGPPTVLIGPNGSGKTTLLRAAMGLIKAARGRVTWAGSESMPPLRRAIVFQRPMMLRRSVAANMNYALRHAGVARAQWRARAEELLTLVGLQGLGERPARRLSGGEQQRLALARALARDPELLFLDEPTASLDPAATKAIEDIVLAVSARGIKVVMSTHDLGEARRLAGDVVLMHRGCIVESGPAAEFFADPRTQQARQFIAGELLV